MINKFIKALAFSFVVLNQFTQGIVDECPQIFQLGSVSTSCSTDVNNSQLRNSFLVKNDSNSQLKKYLVVFAIQSISFYTIENLSLFKYTQLQNKVKSSYYIEGQGLYYISDQATVYVLNQNIYSFESVTTFHYSQVVSNFAIGKSLDYIVYLNNLSQLIIFSQSVGQLEIADNVNAFLFSNELDFVVFKPKNENYYKSFSLKEKKFENHNLFPNCKQDNQKQLYIYGNNLFLVRIDCNNNIVTPVNQQIDLNSIDTRDSDSSTNTDLNINKIYGQIQDIDLVKENVIAFTTINFLFVYDFSNSQYILIKYQQQNFAQQKLLAKIISLNSEKIFLQSDQSLQIIDIVSKKIEYDALCLLKQKYTDEAVVYMHYDPQIMRIFILNNWGKLYQYNYIKRKFEKLIINLDSRSIIEISQNAQKIYITKSDSAYQIVVIDYYSGIILQQINPIWQYSIQQMVMNNEKKLLILIDRGSNIFIFDCFQECKFQKQYPKIFVETQNIFLNQQIEYVLVNDQRTIQKILLDQQKSSNQILTIQEIQQEAQIPIQNDEMIVNLYAHQKSGELVIVTNKSLVYNFKYSSFEFVSFYQSVPLQLSVLDIKRSDNKNITFLRDNSQILAYDSNTGKKLIQITSPINAKIVNYVFDDINFSEVVIICVVDNGYLLHYEGNTQINQQLINRNTDFGEIIIDYENKQVITYTGDMQITKYNYQKNIILNQYSSFGKISNIKVDYSQNLFIHTSDYDIYFKDYDSSYFTSYQSYDQILSGGYYDQYEKRIFSYGKYIQEIDSISYQIKKSYYHNPIFNNKIPQLEFNITAIDILNKLDIFLSFSMDGSLSIWKYSTMEFKKNIQFDSIKCIYPVGGTYYETLNRYYIRCEGGSIYIMQIDKFDFNLIEKYENILQFWKISQIIIIESLDRIFISGHNGYLFVNDPIKDVQLFYKAAHKGWIYDAVFDSELKLIITCGQDGYLRQWNYTPQNQQPNKLYQHNQSIQSMIYDNEIDIILAFDIEGNILILRFKSLTLVKKVPSITQTQILSPYLDVSKNLIIGFSSDKLISLDYNSLLIDQYNAFINKQLSISSFCFDEEKEDIFFLRSDSYLYLWNLQQLQFEYLSYLPQIYTINSKLYYYQKQQLLLIITTLKVFVYDIKSKSLTYTYKQGCQWSSQISQYIICSQGFQIYRITINTENKLDVIDVNQDKQSVNFITIQGINQEIVVYYRANENSLIIYNPSTQKQIQYYQNYHQGPIKTLIVKDQYIITYELTGIIKIAFGNSFQYIYQFDNFRNKQIDNLESFSNNIFFLKANQQLFPYKIQIIDDQIKLINANSLDINCKESSIKFSNNGHDLLVILCSNDLIYTFQVINKEKQFNFKQIQKYRKIMLQDSFIQSLFFIDKFTLALEYQNRQIIIFLSDDYSIKKIGKNEVSEQSDFNIIKIKQKNSNLHSLIYYDVNGIKKLIIPLLTQAKYYSQYNSCQYINQFKASTQINSIFKSIQESYDFFKNYLAILNFNITINLKEKSQFNSRIEFFYQSITNLTIQGQVDSFGQVNSIVQLSKDFIQQGSKYNQLAFYDLMIEQIKNQSYEPFAFENFKNLIMQNIYFDNLLSIKLFKISFIQINNLVLKDWKSLNQDIDLQNTSQLQFFNIKNLQLENLLIQKCTVAGIIEESLFEITNINNLAIKNLIVSSNEFIKSKIFKITYIYNFEMNKVQIENNIKQLQIEKKLQIQMYNQAVFEIQHARKTLIENGSFINNKEIQFIDYQNTFNYIDQNQNEIISKQKNDEITIKKFDFIKNSSQNPIIQIQSQSILFEEVQILKNKLQKCLFLEIVNSIAVFRNITVSENSSKNNLLLLKDSQVTIDKSKFISNKQKYSLLQVIQSNITQIQSQFTENFSKEDGGAYNIQNTEIETVEFRNNIFKRNQAKGSGGAIYTISYQFLLDSNIFEENQAGIGGAIRYQKYIPTFIRQNKNTEQYNAQKQIDSCGAYSNNICQSNKGLIFGMNIGSYPKDALIEYMGKKFKLSQKNIVFEGVRSGQSDESLTIQLLDENEMVIYFPNSFSEFSKNLEDELLYYKAEFFLDNKAQRLQDQDIKIEGSTIKEYQREGFKFSQLFLYGIPNYQSFMFLKTNSIYVVQNNLVNTSELQIFQLQLNFRECQPGEVINQICSDCQIYECKQCLEGTYSLTKPKLNDDQMKQCKKCSSSNSDYCQLNQIKLKKGFWREDEESEIIVECSNNPYNCAGLPEKGYCIQGLIGPLCETCDIRGEIWGMPYGKSYFNQYECRPCKNQSYLIFQVAFAILFIIYTTYTIIQVINQSNLRIICFYIRKTGLLKLGRTAIIGQNTLYFKLLIHQLQLLLNLKPFKIHIQPIFSYSQTISVPVIANVDSIDCFLYAFNQHIPHYAIKFGWCLTYLILVFIISLACYRLFVYYKWKKCHFINYKNYWLNFSISSSLIFYIFITQQGLSDFLIQILSCREIGGKIYIQSQITENCYSSQHLSIIYYVVIPGLKHLQNQSLKNNLNVTNTVQSFFKIRQPFKSHDQVETYKELQQIKKQGNATKDMFSSLEYDVDLNLQVKESNSTEIKNKNNQLCNRVIDSRMGPNQKLNKKLSIPQVQFQDFSQIFHLTKEMAQFNSHRLTESQNML
ncbi:hypothetical protein ABPG74_006536 [Tetrahymena malaccensis]